MGGGKISRPEAVTATVRSWNAAAKIWDPVKLAKIYADDAVLFGGLPAHSVGKTGIQNYFAAYVGQILSAELSIFDEEVLVLGNSAMLVQGFCKFEFELKGGQKTCSELRATWLLDWSAGEIQIRAHHFSPPPLTPPLGNS